VPDRLRIVVGNNTLVRHPDTGGHWACLLQHFLGFLELGHDVVWMETISARDRDLVSRFFERMREFGLAERCLVVVDPEAEVSLGDREVIGSRSDTFEALVRGADLLWNMAIAINLPLLSEFTYRVLVDLDPGHLQGAALRWPLPVDEHDAFVTVGLNLGAPDCLVPDLGKQWITMAPVVHLPMWPAAPAPPDGAAFTSVTNWNWGKEGPEIDGRLYSTSKRIAYLRYVGLPSLTCRPFELATDVRADDGSGDRDVLERHGWTIRHPDDVVPSVETYREYIAGSVAEFGCAKPVFRELRTGWLSDRSACYLASGRPVVCEDTGFSHRIPAGEGLLTVASLEEAVHAVAAVDGGWGRHATAARRVAKEHFDARKNLRAVLDALPR